MDYKKQVEMVHIGKVNIHQEVINSILQMLEINHMQPGDRLPSERELAESLGVSRTSVRQGLKVLESMGRLETRVGSGTYVSSDQVPQISVNDMEFNKKGLQDLIYMRYIVEAAAIRLFMQQHYTPENVAKLEEVVHSTELQEQIAMATGKNIPISYKYNFEFEDTIAEITENQILIIQQHQIHALWAYMWGKLGFLPGKHGVAQRHQKILNAIKDGNVELACKNMKSHIQKNVGDIFPIN